MALCNKKDGGLCKIYTKSDLRPGAIRVYYDGKSKDIATDKDVQELRSIFKMKAFW